MKTFENFAFILAIILVSLLLIVFRLRSTYKYYVPMGWEHQCGKSGGQPVVANVVKLKADCPVANAQITNDLSEHYKVYFSKKRAFVGLTNQQIKGPYDSYEEASKVRAKIIIDFNYQWKPLLVSNFSTSCDH